VVLDKTGIVESGTHEELIAKGGKYKELYEYQFRA
jgi:ABC-type multidrug transport system fused ATPase/permease subunit